MKKMFLIAIILALVTGIAVYSYAGYLERAGKIETVKVVVAAGDIPERTVLTPDMLTEKEIPRAAVHPQAIRDIGSAVGLFTDSAIVMDEPLLSSKLHKQGEKTGGMNYLIPDGKRAISVNVDQVSGVSGFIKQGDRVDVLASMVLNKEGRPITALYPTSLFVLQNIEVLATGSDLTQTESSAPTYTTVTLAVTPDEAVTLDLAATNGTLRLILRSPLDDDMANVKPKIPELNSNVLG